jgi:SRSO17 transposase
VLISSNVDVLTGLMEEFKPCFSKPQFRNFSTYMLGLVACEDKKNIDAINRCFMNAKDQSTLNRFLTTSPWNLQRLEEKRLQLVRTRLPVEEGSTGFLIIDDTINRKTGKHMEEAGYHFDSAEGKAVWGHDIVTTHYVNGETEYPVRLNLYIRKETCLKEQRIFKTKIQRSCLQTAQRLW